MKKYWFYGIMPKDTISEETLSEDQKKIIFEEKNKLTKENLYNNWLGYNKNNYWVFMRHGFEEVAIDEDRGNIARDKFNELLPDLYKFENK